MRAVVCCVCRVFVVCVCGVVCVVVLLCCVLCCVCVCGVLCVVVVLCCVLCCVCHRYVTSFLGLIFVLSFQFLVVNFPRFCLLCDQAFGRKANKNGTKEQKE